jgi:hypothetical protein
MVVLVYYYMTFIASNVYEVYIKTQCPVLNCQVSNSTCAQGCGLDCSKHFPCFQIYTTIFYNNLMLNFSRNVLTSWNCTLEYPSYDCYVTNYEIIMSDSIRSF